MVGLEKTRATSVTTTDNACRMSGEEPAAKRAMAAPSGDADAAATPTVADTAHADTAATPTAADTAHAAAVATPDVAHAVSAPAAAAAAAMATVAGAAPADVVRLALARAREHVGKEAKYAAACGVILKCMATGNAADFVEVRVGALWRCVLGLC